eukprot:COSAG01_NODE_16574_length_1224_cov_3.899556_2_plen_77_part_00
MAALGDVYAWQMRVELAKKTYTRVVKALPTDTRTLFKLTSLHTWLGALHHAPVEWADSPSEGIKDIYSGGLPTLFV